MEAQEHFSAICLRNREVTQVTRKFCNEEGFGGNQLSLTLAAKQNHESELIMLSSLLEQSLNQCNSEKKGAYHNKNHFPIIFMCLSDFIQIATVNFFQVRERDPSLTKGVLGSNSPYHMYLFLKKLRTELSLG